MECAECAECADPPAEPARWRCECEWCEYAEWLECAEVGRKASTRGGYDDGAAGANGDVDVDVNVDADVALCVGMGIDMALAWVMGAWVLYMSGLIGDEGMPPYMPGFPAWIWASRSVAVMLGLTNAARSGLEREMNPRRSVRDCEAVSSWVYSCTWR